MQTAVRAFWFSSLVIMYFCIATGLPCATFVSVQTKIKSPVAAISLSTSPTELTDEIEKKYKQVLLPTVRVKTKEGTGSGVIIESRKLPDGTYQNVILTAKHVITSKSGIPFATVKVSCYLNKYRDLVDFEGHPVAWSSHSTDLAIIVLEYDRKMPYVAKIIPDDKVVRVFDKAYAVGCTLGIIPPSPTEGIITIPYAKRTAFGPIVGLASTPVAGGNSGGGMYVEVDGTWCLVGIVSSTSVNHTKDSAGEDIAILYPNHAWYISADEIRDFLDDKGF